MNCVQGSILPRSGIMTALGGMLGPEGMMEANPYQAPGVSGPPPSREVVFSEEGVRVVQSLSSWMGFLGILYLLGAAFFVLGGMLALASGGGLGLPMLAAFVVGALIIGTAGVWLRESGKQFAHGVSGNDVDTIGGGFRTLRRYLILFGILEGFQLLSALFTLLAS